MPDISMTATIISTAGTLCGALGGIALTGGMSQRREERQAERQREDARTAAHQQAYADLVGAAAQMRVHIETACQRYWKDMNIRLATIQDQATAVGLQASRVALLSPGAVAEGALALGQAASRLSAWAARNAELGDYSGPNVQFLAGQLKSAPDLTDLEARTAEFLRLASGSPG